MLLVVTDGDDTASEKTFEDTIKAAEESNATIYAIGVYSEDDLEHDKKMVRHSKKVLQQLAEATGGLAYFPDNLEQVTPICEQVAKEIRNQYTLGYYPDEHGAGRDVPSGAGEGDSAERPRQALRPHAHRILRAKTHRRRRLAELGVSPSDRFLATPVPRPH